MTTQYPTAADVLVLGGGAAGLMCAIEAGKRGRRVVVLEHNAVLGEKIRISGGGRCNFTNRYAAPDQYLSENPRFCISALSRYTPADFIALIEQHRIPYHEKKLGQLFCDHSSRDIIHMLRDECRAAGVDLRLATAAREVRLSDSFHIATEAELFRVSALVVATGGLSIPKLGATDFGYRVAEQFGIPIVAPAPALVPFTWSAVDAARYRDLSGLSFDAEVTCRDGSFRENVLFTHRGLSGPAILQISSYWRPGDTISIDTHPSGRLDAVLLAAKAARTRSEVQNLLAQRLPRRMAQRWCEVHSVNGPVTEQKDRDLRGLAEGLHRWRVLPAGTEGYRKAEVTRGGVSTRALNPKSMEAREVPGLFFIGEVVDVTGWLGGYNFQWAWASGYAAGTNL
jgi:predicted Rossmann fold flavoprotein